MRRTPSTLSTCLAGAALAALLGAGGAARAQVYSGYNGSPLYAPGVYGVNFGAVEFPTLGFPMSNYGYPGFGYATPGWGAGVGTGYGYGFGWGYGYGGFGYGGYPGYGFMGMSLADQWMLKYQQYALNASRYNLMNAEASTAYQAANLMHQQALQTMLQNYSGGKYAGGGASVPRTYGDEGGGDGRKPAGDIPFDQLVARDGQVLWPLGAPEDGDLGSRKQRATAAIQQLLKDRGEGRDAPVRQVVRARRALSDYAVPAAREIKADHPDDYDDWVNYVSSLDRGLRTLAGLQGAGGRGGNATPRETNIDIRPENQPKSAGDVLKGRVKDEAPKSSDSPGSPDAPKAPPDRPE
jgi:hypothetical protein